uniref:WAP four-disulfide core domain protein 18-like n=1 Tax=Ictidomys tridecemlineatus TaxID=43179 RepID=UPI001A9D5FF2|nr:WAP four-disulfide core domain protein 18-like [Ictidomys tridecemlineatus]
MKAATVLVLVGFVTLGMNMVCARNYFPSQELQDYGECPELPEGTYATCAEMCSGDDSCPMGMKCCSNGCGHTCQKAVFKIPPFSLRIFGLP